MCLNEGLLCQVFGIGLASQARELTKYFRLKVFIDFLEFQYAGVHPLFSVKGDSRFLAATVTCLVMQAYTP